MKFLRDVLNLVLVTIYGFVNLRVIFNNACKGSPHIRLKNARVLCFEAAMFIFYTRARNVRSASSRSGTRKFSEDPIAHRK